MKQNKIKNKKMSKKNQKKMVVQKPIEQQKVTVIIVVKNDELTIRETIESVLKQTLFDIEIIIFNQDSTDQTISNCSSYLNFDSRIHIFTKNKSLLQICSDKVCGDYLIFLKPGQIVQPDALERLYYKAEATGSDIVFTHFQIKTQDNYPILFTTKWELISDKTVFSWKDYSEFILNITPQFIESKLFKREFFQDILHCKSHKALSLDELSPICFCTAQKISYIKQNIITSYILSVDDVVQTDWKLRILKLTEIEHFLNKNYIYPSVEKSFLNYVLDYFQLLTLYPEPYQGIIRNYLTNEGWEYFHFDTHGGYFYQNKLFLEKLKSLKDSYNLSKDLENIYERNKEKIIPIVFSANKLEDVYYTFLNIQALKEYSVCEYFYDIYILYTNLSQDTVLNLERMSDKGHRITCINVELYLKSPVLSKFKEISSFYTLLLPDLLKGYKKVLYLSSNVLIQSDISSLFYFDLMGNSIAGAMAYSNKDHIENELNLVYELYVSSDVLLIDMEKWCQQNTLHVFDKFINYNIYSLIFQDIVNLIFKGKINIFSSLWNISIEALGKKEIYDAKYLGISDCHILNYKNCSPLEKFNSFYSSIWWISARKSSYYEEILAYALGLTMKKSNRMFSSTSVVQPINPPKRKDEIDSQMVSDDEILADKMNYIKESIKMLFSFGKKRRLHKKNLVSLYSKITNNKIQR